MQIIKKEKFGNKRKVTLFGFIKFSYKTQTKENLQKKQNVCILFSGDYASWAEASNMCKGYSAQNILDKTLESVMKVKSGEAVFERDSCIFDKVQYSFPLLSCLFKVAVENNNELNILDFGGALGSHYFQNKDFLKPIKINSWAVVEQPHYVEAGNEKIADGILNFKNTIDEVDGANVLLLSGVLQYLPNPYDWIEKFIQKGIDYIIVDRTAFSTENRNRLTIETVPICVYDAKYPAWFFKESDFLEKFSGKYDMVLDFDDTIDNIKNFPCYFKGYLFKRKRNDF